MSCPGCPGATRSGCVIAPVCPNRGSVSHPAFDRTGTRIPLQWDDSPNDGFSSAPAPALYLPVEQDPARPRVATQADDPGSLLSLVRCLRRWHREAPALTSPLTVRTTSSNYPLQYRRGEDCGADWIEIALNPSSAEVELSPGGTAYFQLADVMIHSQDIRRPLGIAHSYAADDLRAVLEFLVSPAAARGFVSRRRLQGLRFVADDLDGLAVGEGALVQGPAEAIILALTGRTVALADLTGDGVAVLAARLSRG